MIKLKEHLSKFDEKGKKKNSQTRSHLKDVFCLKRKHKCTKRNHLRSRV